MIVLIPDIALSLGIFVVTAQNAQIQALIHEIDQVINRPSPQMPWRIASGEVEQQRRGLEKIRDYLILLDQQIDQQIAAEVETLVAARVAELGSHLPHPPRPALVPAPAETAQQVLQAVLQEMSYLRSNVMQSLRNDIEGLQQRREALAQEIRLLETQRQQYLSPIQVGNQQQIINQFLQSLMAQLQENLTGQVAQMLSNLEAQTLAEGQTRTIGQGHERSPSPYHAAFDSEVAITYATALSPTQRLEHLKMIQIQSDQLLLKLDATLRVIFESLQNNVQTYQDALSQGLDRMYSMGQQGEALFSTFVNRLAQELGREASTYLHAAVPSTSTVQNHDVSSSQGDEAHQSGFAPRFDETLFDQPDEFATVLQLDEPESTDSSADLADLALLDLDFSQVALDPDASEVMPLEDEIDLLLQTDSQPEPLSLPIDTDEDTDEAATGLAEEPSGDRSPPVLPSALPSASPPEINLQLISVLDLLGQSTDQQGESELAIAQDTTTLETAAQDIHPDINQTIHVDARPTATDSTATDLEEPDPDRNLEDLYESLFGATAIQPPLEEDLKQLASPLDFDSPVEAQPQAMEASWLDPLAISDERVDEKAAESSLDSIEVPLIAGDFLLEEPSPAPPTPEPSIKSILSNTTDPFLLEASSEPHLNAIPSLDTAQPVTPPSATEATESEPIDAITRLTDLIPVFDSVLETENTANIVDIGELSNPSEQNTPSDALVQTDAAEEDEYIPASLEETLLVSEQDEAQKRLNVRLSANTLQQLAVDLSSLEGLDTELVSFTPPLEAIDDWTTPQPAETASTSASTNPSASESLADGQWAAIESDLVEARSVPLEMEPESNQDTPLVLPTESMLPADLQLPVEQISPVEDDETAALLFSDPDVVTPQTPSVEAPIATPLPVSESLFESVGSLSIENLFDTPTVVPSPPVDAADPTAAADWSSLTTLEDLFAATELDQLFLDDAGAEPATFDPPLSSSVPDQATSDRQTAKPGDLPSVDLGVVTLADLFGSDQPTLDVTELPPSDPFQTGDSVEELNAFTLEGLDSLFEEVPTAEPSSVPIQPPVDSRPTDLNPDLFLTKEQIVQASTGPVILPDRPHESPEATQKKSP